MFLCPNCGHKKNQIEDTRLIEEGACARRHRKCWQCWHRWTTYEDYSPAAKELLHQRINESVIAIKSIKPKQAVQLKPSPILESVQLDNGDTQTTINRSDQIKISRDLRRDIALHQKSFTAVKSRPQETMLEDLSNILTGVPDND